MIVSRGTKYIISIRKIKKTSFAAFFQFGEINFSAKASLLPSSGLGVGSSAEGRNRGWRNLLGTFHFLLGFSIQSMEVNRKSRSQERMTDVLEGVTG